MRRILIEDVCERHGENKYDNVKNYNVSVIEEGDDIIFLRKIVRGGADKSYGIAVAKLAGLPEEIINRAKIILDEKSKQNNL